MLRSNPDDPQTKLKKKLNPLQKLPRILLSLVLLFLADTYIPTCKEKMLKITFQF